MSVDDLGGFISEARTHQLGRVAVNFQHVEISLAFLTWHLIPTDQDTGAVITSQLSFDRLLTVFCLLLRRRLGAAEDLGSELGDIGRMASELEQQRNALMHPSLPI